MNKKCLNFVLAVCLLILAFTGCASKDDGKMADGEYQIEIQLEGGSGKASIESPATVTIRNGEAMAHIVWSSSHYDYMIVDDVKYEPVNTEGNSAFDIPVSAFDEPITVIADTTAMSTPHEVEYQITFMNEDDAAKDEESLSETEASAFEEISSQLKKSGSIDFEYARELTVEKYEGDYLLVTIHNQTRYLLLPDGKEPPSDLAADVIVIRKPLSNIYIAASAVMDMFVSIDSLEHIAFSSLKANDWYIEEAKRAMEEGSIAYAGKYSAPDYEQILSGGCDLAIENTMIYHTPEVKEKIEKFGIPALVDYSSYEAAPLGRMEWVKFYGLLTDHYDEAVEAFETQKALLQKSDDKTSDQSVVFFYISSDGKSNVRKSNDYLAQMISLAGGRYVFDSIEAEDEAGTFSMTMEDFYAQAVDADYIIYNSAIQGELTSLQDLLALSPLLEKFKAVKEDRVYCTYKNIYQSSMQLGSITDDIRKMLNGDDQNMNYLFKLD